MLRLQAWRSPHWFPTREVAEEISFSYSFIVDLLAGFGFGPHGRRFADLSREVSGIM
jgi:hypothetical protein